MTSASTSTSPPAACPSATGVWTITGPSSSGVSTGTTKGSAWPASGRTELLPAGDPELASHLDAIAERELAHLNEPGLAARVQGCVEALLPTGRPTLDMVARLVDRSTRSLQRALQQEGTSFKELVEAGQRSQAMRYIRETDHPLSAIALAVGFDDPSHFARAFRRVSGLSPREFRRC